MTDPEPAGPRPRLGLGRPRRLPRRSDFRLTYDGGLRFRGRYHTLFCIWRGETPDEVLPWRLGITATRKTGKSHVRNRTRRRVREFFRLNQERIPEGWNYVVNTTGPLATASPEDLSRDLNRSLAGVRAIRKNQRKPAPPDSGPASGS